MSETGKQRQRRIDPTYLDKVAPAVVWKRILGLVGFLVGSIYVAFVVYDSVARHRSSPLNTGPLSTVHSSLGSDGCEKCHIHKSSLISLPIRSDAIWSNDFQTIHANNQKCISCHPTATGHYSQATKKEVVDGERCSDCHREHQGENNRLISLNDNQCTVCHKEIAAYTAKAPAVGLVTAFDLGKHPEFQSIKSDPGTLSFSHAQHMRPGQPGKPGGADAMKLENLPPAAREQYRLAGQLDSELVQLDCKSCHTPDTAANSIHASREPTTPDHRYYQAIDFQKHCQACHVIPFGVPHGKSQEETMVYLKRFAAGELVASKYPAELQVAVDELANQMLVISKSESVALPKNDAVRLPNYLGFCSKCHTNIPTETNKLSASTDQAEVKQESTSGQDWLNPNIKRRWLTGANFSHASHSNNCSECHKDAYASDGTTAKQVMIPGIENCTKCHKAHGNAAGSIARADCLECHRYHVDPMSKPSLTQPSHSVSAQLGKARSLSDLRSDSSSVTSAKEMRAQ